jgi:hypothetical protein
MYIERHKPNCKLYIGIPVFIFISCYLITQTTAFKTNSEALSYGILADLLLTSPLIYFLLIRKSSISKATIIRVILLGILVSGLILNPENFAFVDVLKKWVSPLIELFVFLFIIRKFRKLNSESKLRNINNTDFLIHCREVFTNMLGSRKMGNIIASEISMIYYAFFGRAVKMNTHKYSSYKESAILALLYALLMILIIETIAMHFVFAMLGNVFAWTLTALSLYTCIQLFAHIRAVKLRQITIDNDILNLYMGLAADAKINIANIRTIELTRKEVIDKDVIKISLLKKLEGHNLRIELYEPIEVIKMFGLKKESKTVLFFVDDPNKLRETLMGLMSKIVE